MPSLQGVRRSIPFILLLAAAAPDPAAATAWPAPVRDRFSLFSTTFARFRINRVDCGITTRGEICAGQTGVDLGGAWPRGTVDGYVFNSGLQVAGIIQGAKSASNPWGGDTAGGFFFDPKGTQRHGVQVTPIYDASNPADVAIWPDLSRVPDGDTLATLFDPALRGRISASPGDLHFISWEGDPQALSGRPHPLGILADFRVMGWNYPRGNDDVMYVLITLFNVTSANAADYARYRPALRSLLLQQGQQFQALNNARFFAGTSSALPVGGYTIGPMYAGISVDPDVGSAGVNYSSVNLPFGMGYGYQSNFGLPFGWSFPAEVFGSSSIAGAGFVGTKFLASEPGQPPILMWTTFTGGSSFPTPGGVPALFRLLSAQPVPGLDGQGCSYGVGPVDPRLTHICFVKHSPPSDTRFMQSAPGFVLAPGDSHLIPVAYIFAAAAAIPGFTPTSATGVDPGNPGWTNHPDSMLARGGVPLVDSLTGFLGYTGPTAHNPDGSEHQPLLSEFRTAPRSLLGKAQLAQAIFDRHFPMPEAPAAPEFFLIAGSHQVTVLWKPSASETSGDPYFAAASTATDGTGPNPLYDPNYRQFDVEGYRIYRGRTDAPASMRLLAQFDYQGTVFRDFGGVVVSASCAPELGVTTGCSGSTAITPGITSTVHRDYPLDSTLVQAVYGDRTVLSNGLVGVLRADTAITGGGSAFPPLGDTGVPFVFVDSSGAPGCAACGVSQGVTYYYAVSAFDVNSIQSSPSSLESGRTAKAVTVQAPAVNYQSNAAVTISGPYGRSGLLTDTAVPTIDPATGIFSKKQPPTNAASLSIGTVVAQVLTSGTVSVQLDSVTYVSTADGGNTVTLQWFTAAGARLSVPVTINTAGYNVGGVSRTQFGATPLDATLAAAYGGGNGYRVSAELAVQAPAGYTTGTKGRGCINGSTATTAFTTNPGRQCAYNGPRWFVGDQETTPNPASDNPDFFDGVGTPLTFANAGKFAGVARIFHPVEYLNTATAWRRVAGAMTGFISAADYRLYWGSGGVVDSVIDLTHNTVVPFAPDIQASWGVLNGSAVPLTSYDHRAELTFTDISCVAPFKADGVVQGALPCTGSTTALLSRTAIPGPVVICASAPLLPSFACNQTALPQQGSGFALYLKGELFVVELAGGLPAAGTAWTMRDYTGAIVGGNGVAGNWGDYAYHPDSLRPFTAPGVSLRISVQANNAVLPATAATLDRVHTVPDPYYVTSAYDGADGARVIKFVNLPEAATIRIYSTSGRLVRVLTNGSASHGGSVDWDVKDGHGKRVATGVYFYTVSADGISRTYRMTVVVNYSGSAP